MDGLLEISNIKHGSFFMIIHVTLSFVIPCFRSFILREEGCPTPLSTSRTGPDTGSRHAVREAMAFGEA